MNLSKEEIERQLRHLVDLGEAEQVTRPNGEIAYRATERWRPEIPDELWMIWSGDYADPVEKDCMGKTSDYGKDKGLRAIIGWVSDSDGLCCFLTREDAEFHANEYHKVYRIKCLPVQVKGATK